MKLKILFKNSSNKNIEYSKQPDFFHNIFSTALAQGNVLEKTHKKQSFCFNMPDINILLNNKTYTVYFNSNKDAYIKSIIENLNKSNNIKVLEIIEIDNSYDNMKPILVKGISYKLTPNFCISKGISRKRDEKEKTNINFSSKYHDLFLLKELIEYQISNNFNLFSENKLENTIKINENKGYNDCIESLIIKRDYFRVVKNFNVPCFDITFKFKSNLDKRLVQQISNFILQDGLGSKNSFGFGYVYQEEN